MRRTAWECVTGSRTATKAQHTDATATDRTMSHDSGMSASSKQYTDATSCQYARSFSSFMPLMVAIMSVAPFAPRSASPGPKMAVLAHTTTLWIDRHAAAALKRMNTQYSARAPPICSAADTGSEEDEEEEEEEEEEE